MPTFRIAPFSAKVTRISSTIATLATRFIPSLQSFPDLPYNGEHTPRIKIEAPASESGRYKEKSTGLKPACGKQDPPLQ
jgi:hypothetical protein